MQTEFIYDCTPTFVHFAYKFTGKERDTESGLDYFGARYYGSNMGRFMSPDWSAGPSAVPYASLSNPQSLNLYGYVNNNPLSRVDVDGHCSDEDGPPDNSCGSRFTKSQVASIVYNEAGGLLTPDGASADSLYTHLAHALYNGELLTRQPDHAPDTVSDAVAKSDLYQHILSLVDCACEDAKKGKDTVGGADLYNNRYGKKEDLSDRRFYNTKNQLTGTAPVSKMDGPFTRRIGKTMQSVWETFERSKDAKPVPPPKHPKPCIGCEKPAPSQTP